MKERAQILAENPIEDVFDRYDIPLRGGGKERTTHRCAFAEHKPSHQCVSVNVEKHTWYCNDCQKGGSVIDFVAGMDGTDVKTAMTKLAGGDEVGLVRSVRAKFEDARGPSPTPAAGKIVKTYDYRDGKGVLLYQVCRMEPKSFRQRQPTGNDWKWTMEGATRVLYNLAAVRAAEFVWVVEGEKDADTLNGINAAAFNATCNVGGAGKWEDSYSRTLNGKEVILCGDNDDAGRKHVAKIQEALAGHAKSVRVVDLPPEYKDVTEYVGSFKAVTDAGNALYDLAEKAEVLHGGVKVPVKSLAEIEREYIAFIQRCEKVSLHMDGLFPKLTLVAGLRPVVPGELVTFLAGTGVGKTMIIQNLARTTRLTTLLFEMELPATLTFERFVGIETMMRGAAVVDSYKEGRIPKWKGAGLDHIHVCSESRLTVKQMEEIIAKTGIKLGHTPHLVIVDYAQLIQGTGGSRYERLSGIAEELKIMAKVTNTIVVITSQVGRSEGCGNSEVSLFDAKDSGSIENSSGLVMGAWKDPNDRTLMYVKVLKNTKGKSGDTTEMRLGSDLRLIEIQENRTNATTDE